MNKHQLSFFDEQTRLEPVRQVERRLFLFDVVGTLVHAPGKEPPIPNTPGEAELLENRVEIVRRLHQQGHVIGVHSNQGGVAWGFLPHATASRIVHKAGDAVGAVYYGMCPHHPDVPAGRIKANPSLKVWAHACRCRKPAPGMIQRAMATLAASQFDFEGAFWDGWRAVQPRTIVVGDSVADKLAAEAAGAAFAFAGFFFEGTGWRTFVDPDVRQICRECETPALRLNTDGICHACHVQIWAYDNVLYQGGTV